MKSRYEKIIDELLNYAQYDNVVYKISTSYNSGINVKISYAGTIEEKNYKMGADASDISKLAYMLCDKLPKEYYVDISLNGTEVKKNKYYMKFKNKNAKESNAQNLKEKLKEISADINNSDSDIPIDEIVNCYYEKIVKIFESKARESTYSTGKTIDAIVDINNLDFNILMKTQLQSIGYGNGIFISTQQRKETWNISPSDFGFAFLEGFNKKCIENGVLASILVYAYCTKSILVSSTIMNEKEIRICKFEKNIIQSDWMWNDRHMAFLAKIKAEITY